MFESINNLSSLYPLSTLCSVLGINKSSYIYWLKTHSKNTNLKISFYHKIIKIYSSSHGLYGAPKITAILNKQNIHCSISTVSRAMSIIGIRSIVSKHFPKKISTITNEEKSLIINLIKNLNITHLNQVWTTDITYINTLHDGTFYLISFIDLFSKKVVSWVLFTDQKTDKILFVLKKALAIRHPSPGLIIHSDKGPQFRSKLYRKFLSDHNFPFSYTSLDHSCDENASQESFHASLKKESLYLENIYTFQDAYKLIYDYIEGFYNPFRIHSSIGYLSPDDFEKSLK